MRSDHEHVYSHSLKLTPKSVQSVRVVSEETDLHNHWQSGHWKSVWMQNVRDIQTLNVGTVVKDILRGVWKQNNYPPRENDLKVFFFYKVRKQRKVLNGFQFVVWLARKCWQLCEKNYWLASYLLLNVVHFLPIYALLPLWLSFLVVRFFSKRIVWNPKPSHSTNILFSCPLSLL